VGPIPVLLSGPFTAQELKPDPSIKPDLLENLLERKPERTLDNFLSEEAFFEKDQSNS
jgi:hypothetical protein